MCVNDACCSCECKTKTECACDTKCRVCFTLFESTRSNVCDACIDVLEHVNAQFYKASAHAQTVCTIYRERVAHMTQDDKEELIRMAEVYRIAADELERTMIRLRTMYRYMDVALYTTK